MMQEHFKFRALETYIPKVSSHLKVFQQRIDNCIKTNNGKFDDVKPVISTFVLDTLGGKCFPLTIQMNID